MSDMQLQETDYKWFLENYKKLFEQFGDCEGWVGGSSDDRGALY